MRLPVKERTQAEFALAKFCQQRITPAMRAQVRLEYAIRGLAAILVERRPPWPSPTPDEEWLRILVARFRFAAKTATWTLDWRDSDERWHPYAFTRAKTLVGLLREVDRDPTGIFWG